MGPSPGAVPGMATRCQSHQQCSQSPGQGSARKGGKTPLVVLGPLVRILSTTALGGGSKGSCKPLKFSGHRFPFTGQPLILGEAMRVRPGSLGKCEDGLGHLPSPARGQWGGEHRGAHRGGLGHPSCTGKVLHAESRPAGPGPVQQAWGAQLTGSAQGDSGVTRASPLQQGGRGGGGGHDDRGSRQTAHL